MNHQRKLWRRFKTKSIF